MVGLVEVCRRQPDLAPVHRRTEVLNISHESPPGQRGDDRSTRILPSHRLHIEPLPLKHYNTAHGRPLVVPYTFHQG